MAKGFLPYNVDQGLLLPPDVRAWLPEGHLALLVLDVVRALDLSEIYRVHDLYAFGHDTDDLGLGFGRHYERTQ